MLLFNYIILLFFSFFRENDAQISETLNPTQQKFSVQLNTTDLNNKIYIISQFRYVPLAYFYNNLTTKNQMEKNQLIFGITSDTSPRMFAYLQIKTDFRIFVKLQTIDTKTQEISFIEEQFMIDTYQIEGNWFTIEFRNNLLLGTINITIYQNKNKSNIFSKLFQVKNLYVNEIFQLEAGLTQLVDLLNLEHFQGPIKLQQLDWSSKYYPISLSCSYNSKQQMLEQDIFSSEHFFSYQLTERISNCFGLQGWVKVSMAELNDTIYILTVFANPIALENIQSEILTITYQIFEQQELITIVYQSYTFPVPILDEKHIKYSFYTEQKILQNWHYLSILYKENILSFKIQYPLDSNLNINKQFQNVYFYSDTNQTIFLGAYYSDKYYYNNAQGDFFNFYYFYQVGTNFPTISCNINCETCFGPYSNQCITCSSKQHRIQYPNSYECLCQLGYVDLEDGYCYDSFSEAQINLLPLSDKLEYDREDPIVVCSFGYFKYQDKCYLCPKLNKKYPCFFCLQNPNDWVYNPKCHKQQQQLDQNDDYVYESLSNNITSFVFYDYYVIFVFSDEQLTFCDNCAKLCLDLPLETSCYLSSYYHLSELVYIECDMGSIFINGKCENDQPKYCEVSYHKDSQFICENYPQKQQPNNYCQNLSGEKNCQMCINGYFLSLNHGQCIFCGIKNCKICFYYSMIDQSLTSLITMETDYNDEDLVIGCALCLNEYQFNFNTGMCELAILQLPDCQHQYLDVNFNQICFETNSNDFTKGTTINQCQKYMFNCQKCFQPIQYQYYCVECNIGYYFDGNQGICKTCQSFNQDFITCYSQFTYQNDQSFLDAIGFTFTYQKLYPINIIDLDMDQKVIPSKCVEGKQVVTESCVSIATSFCSLFDEQCKQCETDKYGTRRLTMENLMCVDCPYYCEYCLQRITDTKLLNPYFQPSIATYKLQCLQKRNIEYLFIDNQFGQIRNCNSTFKKCENELVIVSTQYNIFRSYFYLLYPEDIELLNIKAISIVKLVLDCVTQMVFEDTFYEVENLVNLFSKEVLTLYQTEILIYNSQQICQILSFAKVQIINIQKLEINYIQLNFSIFYNSSISLISQTPITLLLLDVTIVDSNFKPELAYSLNLTDPIGKYSGRSYQISINYPNNVTLKNILISNMSFISTQFIYLNFSSPTQLEIYNTENLTIQNCNFIDSIFSSFNGQWFKNITYTQVRIQNCTFINSSFVQFQSKLGLIYLNNIVFKDCTFVDADILDFDQSQIISLSDINFINCIFQWSKAISIQSSIYFQQLLVENCYFQYSQIIYGYSFSDVATQVNFKQFVLQNIIQDNSDIFKIIGNQLNFYIDELDINNFTSPVQSQNYVFSIFGDKLVAKSIFLKRNINCQEFFFQNFSTINISDLNVTSYDTFELNQQFLYIRGSNITIKDVHISDQNIMDDKLIFIESASLDSENQILELQNWLIVNCSCTKSQQKYVSSIVFLNLLGEYQIILTNSIFKNIWQNQELQDPEIASASILVLNAPSSQVDFVNITIYNCLIANSSDSNLLIKTSKFRFLNSKTNYINTYLRDSNNYIQFRYGQDFQFSQQSFGGLAYIQTQDLIVSNCSFTNTISLYGGTLYIVTKYNGNVELSNLLFVNQTSSLDQYSNGIGGALFLDSDNSLLKFNLKNIKVKNSSSSYQAGFLFIKPSRYSNQILINNLNLDDVFSKSSSIFSFTNTIYQKSDSIIIFVSVKITNQEVNYQKFKNYYKIIDDLTEGDGLLQIFGSNIKISNLSFQGFAQEKVLFLNFQTLMIIERLYIKNSSLNSQYLIKVTNVINSTQNYIVINEIQISNCSQINDQANSLLGIFLQGNQYKINLEKIQFSQNQCPTCENGLLFIQSLNNHSKQNIKLQYLLFYQNYCGQQGCLSLEFQQQTIQPIIIIQSGNFISNSAIQGGAINCAFSICKIFNCQFLQNEATQGGAAYLNNTNENPFYNNYFIKNSAQIGGSLYFVNNSTVTNDSNFLLLNNKAQMFANNIAEQPRFLQFIINGVEISNREEVVQNVKIDRPDISEIFYPSGVKLAEYLYFNYTSLNYNKINYQILLKAYNHLHEEIIELDGTYCQLQNPNKVITLYSNDKTIYFDPIQQVYDFNKVIFISNPNNEGTLIDLYCTSIKEEYHLQFVIKTFKCQIGEYFFENMCLRCDSLAGYYSVDLGTTCKRIDIAMIIETTGAMLNLQPYYWRPSLHSDVIEPCRKMPQKCQGGWYPGDASCIQGGVGGLCEECDLYNIQGFGHFFNSGTGDCKVCGSLIIQIVFLLISSIWTVILTLMTYKSTQNSLQRLAQLKIIYLKFQTLYTFSLDQTSILIKMSNNYFQILMVISTFQITFFNNLKDAFEFLGETSSFMTYQFDCTLASLFSIPYIYSHYIMIIVVTVFNHAFTTIIFIITVALKFNKFSSTYFYTSIFYLYTYNQQPILNWGISLASKRTISDEDYIQASVNYKYYTQEHFEWLFQFVIPTILFFGILIPLLILYILCRYRKKLYHKMTRKLLSYLINEYSDNSYYWEIVRISLKIIIIVTVNFLEQQIEIKGILIVIFILVYYKLLIFSKPYRQTQFNQLEQNISFNAIMTILLSLLLSLTEQINKLCSYILEFLILSLILNIVMTFIRQLFLAFLRRLNEQLDFIRQYILFKFPTLQVQFPFFRKYLQLKKHQSQRVNQRFNKIRSYLRKKLMSQRDELPTRATGMSHQRLATTILMTQADEYSIK